MFSDSSDVGMPKSFPKLSTKRVLTMEFIQGARVNDCRALEQMGIEKQDVARRLVAFFGDQIFQHGFVHCDPHPGNILVRGDGKLIVLDFGMVRRLQPTFRYEFCCLWKALITRDLALARRGLQGMGVDPAHLPLISFMLTYSIPTARTRIGERMSREERKKLRERYKGFDVSLVIEGLPRDLLFVLKTMSTVRSINKDLGGSTRARLFAWAECALKGLQIPTFRKDDKKNDVNALVDSERCSSAVRRRLPLLFELWRMKFLWAFLLVE